MELLPLKGCFAPHEPIAVEVRGLSAPADVFVFHLDEQVAVLPLQPGQNVIAIPPLGEGGYGVELRAPDAVATSAFDVLADPLLRPRYGFAADFAPGGDTGGVADTVRRLHLNAVQFYDWMYRHAQLLPPSDQFTDALGRVLSLTTVRTLVQEVRAVGALPLGYAAVYAAGRDAWPRWQEHGLYRADGRPWMLEDFLWLVDPTSDEWLVHFTAELAGAAEAVGFAGFHLDQYGHPKRALRRDGSDVDLATAFPALIARVREALPDARLIFNNVNGFPLWTTARAPQDAVYVEAWPPHERLDHLACLCRRAREAAGVKPVIVAAYMSVFALAPEEEALAAAKLVMATLFSHGTHHLLAGEDGHVLTDPYYPNSHRLSAAALVELSHWYDFAVRYGDLLYDEEAVDVTTTLTAGINREVRVHAAAPVAIDPEPGAVWVRLLETRYGLVVHLIDLSADEDLVWDAPRPAAREQVGVCLELFRAGALEVLVATPGGEQRLQRVENVRRDEYDVVELPPWSTWTLILVRQPQLS